MNANINTITAPVVTAGDRVTYCGYTGTVYAVIADGLTVKLYLDADPIGAAVLVDIGDVRKI